MVAPQRRSPSYKRKHRRWKSLKYSARARLDSSGRVGMLIRRLWGSGSYAFLKGRRGLAPLVARPTGTFYDMGCADRVSWVSPQRIRYCSLQGFNIRTYKGRVIGGDWDLLEKEFDDLDIVVAFKQVCFEAKAWSETVFYQRNLEMINEGHIRWGCRNQAEFDGKCRERELLFQTIKDEGYKSQRELATAQQGSFRLRAEDEVIVSIGRHGDLLFSDGAHRLAIAKLLGIPEIPVAVAVRHSEWVAFRQALQRCAREARGVAHYPLSHPDLEGLPVFRTADEHRFGLIKETMAAKGGRILDLGADLGYFCHRFEDEGFACCAAEDSPERFHCLTGLKRAENREFKTIAEPVLDSAVIRNARFDVVLALNTFHRFLDTKRCYDRFVDFLEDLETDELFFEPHHAGKPQATSAYKNYAPDEFVVFLLDKLRLINAECIGTTKDMTPLYRLY